MGEPEILRAIVAALAPLNDMVDTDFFAKRLLAYPAQRPIALLKQCNDHTAIVQVNRAM